MKSKQTQLYPLLCGQTCIFLLSFVLKVGQNPVNQKTADNFLKVLGKDKLFVIHCFVRHLYLYQRTVGFDCCILAYFFLLFPSDHY